MKRRIIITERQLKRIIENKINQLWSVNESIEKPNQLGSGCGDAFYVALNNSDYTKEGEVIIYTSINGKKLKLYPQGGDTLLYTGDGTLLGRLKCPNTNPEWGLIVFKGKLTPDTKYISLASNSPDYWPRPKPKSLSPATKVEDLQNCGFAVYMGMKGELVKKIQQMLMASGYDLPIYKDNSKFGKETKDAVIKFQEDNKLKKIDGIVGCKTYPKLVEKSTK
jgi:hypothetical protein